MPSLASKSSGGHQVSLTHSTKAAAHADIISAALFSQIRRSEEKKLIFKKTSSGVE